MMQQMFQTGIEVQQENARAMQRLFDTFWQEADAADRPTGTGAANAPRPGGSKAGRGGR